jgi:hypothetical protein
MMKKRINLYNKFRDNAPDITKFDAKYPDFTTWDATFFNNEDSVKSIWHKSLKFVDKTTNKKLWGSDLSDFYATFVCSDKSWAKNGAYCKSSVTPVNPSPPIGGGGTTLPPSVPTDWLPDPTGNKKYVYQVRDCKWIAKNTKTNKEFNISDNPKYQSSVDILNGKYPNSIKDCDKSKPKVDDKAPVVGDVSTVNLPDWANCIKIIPTSKVTQDSNQEQIVFSQFGKDTGYFWQDMTFLYVTQNGTKTYGKWSCKDNILTINTNDGQVWTKNTGWVKTPTKSEVPDQNFGTTWATPDELSGANEPKPDTTLNQNESTMDNLETIINEVNSLIIEQTQQVVQAPKDELNTLATDPLLKSAGTLEALCRTNNGTSKPIQVNGKIYFAGKSFNRKNNAGIAYITYDGRVLERVDNTCNFKYVTGATGPIQINGIPYSDLAPQQTEILKRFNINPLDYNSDPYYFINNITNKFQKLITDKQARSGIFKNWNDMLSYWSPGTRLTGNETSFSYPPNDELDQYNPVTADALGLTYMDRQIKIFVPRGERLTSDFSGAKYDPVKCRADLVAYLSAAFEFEKEGTVNNSLNSNSVRKGLQGCYRSGVFDKMDPIKPTDMNVQFTKKDNPFTGMRGFGNDLDIKDVQKLLTGEHFKLPNVGPSGKNPFLPLTLDRRNMNESKTKLNTLIKENLQKLSEEKNKNLLAETKIIQTRTQILTENRILKFKQPREKFFNEIISEAIYLESQGFDKQLIKEEFWDTLKGLFGQHGSEAIFGTFKEYMGKWLLQKLTPVNPDGWIGSIIVAAIGNLHIDDLSKLTDCNFLTKKIASSIGEGIARKIQHDKGFDGGISDIVRNGLFSAIDNNEMVKSLENGLAKLICPALSGVKTKLEDKAQQMRLKAVQA